MDKKKFSKRRGGFRALSLGADISIYFDAPVREYADGLLFAYDRFLRWCNAERLMWYRTATMATHKQVTSRTLSMPKSWLKPGAKGKDTIGLSIRDGDRPEDTPEWQFHFFVFSEESPYFEDRSGFLQVLMPASVLAEDPDSFLELVYEMMDNLSFASGHGGYVLVRSVYDVNEAYDLAYPLSMRHPGADIADMMNASRAVRKERLKGVNWITMLGPTLTSKLGGVKELKGTCPQCVSMVERKNSVLLKAGKKPEVGDVSRRNFLPEYRAAFGLVEPILVDSYPRFDLGTTDEQEKTNRWIRRFADD